MGWFETTGRGRVAYALEIAGLGVFTTLKGWTPTDSWFTDAGYGAARVHPWLDPKSLGSIKETTSPLEGHLKVSDLKVDIVDLNGGMTGLFKSWKARSYAYLTADITSTATSIPVDNVAAFSTSEIGWIGSECIYWTSTGAASLEVPTISGAPARGWLGTEKRAHDRDLTVVPPAMPVIADGPHTIVGRRALLHVAEVDDAGTVGATEVVYRGIVGKPTITPTTWRLPISHVWNDINGEVGQSLPSTDLVHRQYWYSHNSASAAPDPGQLCCVKIVNESTTPPYVKHVDPNLYDREETATGNTEWFTDGYLTLKMNDSMRWIAAVGHTGFGPTPEISGAGAGDKLLMKCEPGSTDVVHVDVRAGDPYWALGFAPGRYTFVGGASDNEHQAEDKPRLCVVDLTGRESLSPFLHVADATQFTTDLWVQVPGWPYVGLKATGSGPELLQFYGNTWDQRYPLPSYLAIEKPEDMIIRHVIATRTVGSTATDNLKGALKRYTGHHATATEPKRWLRQRIRYDDVAWGELDTATAGIDPHLDRWRDCITEGTEAWKSLEPAFACLGICPRLTDDGKVGFYRIKTPTAVEAETVELDSSIWEAFNAASVEVTLQDDPIISSLRVYPGFDYRTGKHTESSVKIIWRDGWNTVLDSFSQVQKPRGWHVDTGYVAGSLDEFAARLEPLVDATHFGVYGRLAGTVDVPCTWKARQLKCGDIVKVTHELVPDIAEGAQGVDSRLALIVGRIRHLTKPGEDHLIVRLPGETRAKGIAPCAQVTAYSTSDATAYFASSGRPLYAQSTSHDLAAFDRGANVDVLLISRNTATYAEYAATLSSVTAATAGNPGVVAFTYDPFSTSGMPTSTMWMVLPGYSTAVAWMTDYAYQASTATVPVLHSSGGTEPADEWSI